VVSWGWSWSVSWGGLVSWLLRVDSGSLVGHIGNIAVIAVGGVGHVLDPAVGKSNRVRSGHVAGTIGLLLALEVGLGVVISHGVGEGVGGDLIGVFLGLVGGGGLVSSGSWLVSNRGRGISWGSVDNRCVVSDGVMSDWVDRMMSDWVNCVVGNWVNCVVGNWVNRVVGNWVDSVVDSVVGNWVDSVVDWGNSVVRDHSSLANWDDFVGSNGGLDLRQTLGVVGLSH